MFVVAAFGQILSEEILSMPRYGCINIHASLLPKYRGSAPIQQVILDGEKETGVTIMQMDKGIDTGDMLLQRAVPIAEKETGDSLHDKLAETGADLIVEALRKLEAGELTPQKQNDELSSYVKERGADRKAGAWIKFLAGHLYLSARKDAENMGKRDCGRCRKSRRRRRKHGRCEEA